MAEKIRPEHFDRSSSRGKEIFEVTPITLGGSPTDLENKVLVDRDEHMRLVVYWNRLIRNIRAQDKNTTRG